MDREEVIGIIEKLMLDIHSYNYYVYQEIDREASKHDDYDALSDRYLHIERREMPTRDNSKDRIYQQLLVDKGLDKYFSEYDFNEIYNVCMLENKRGNFYFGEAFAYMMKKYIYFQEYKKSNNDSKSFLEFIRENLYEKMTRQEAYEIWKAETEEKQKAFVPKTNEELKQLYDKYKPFLDMNYLKYVDKLDCMDILPFSEYLRLFDLAHRNYRNIDALVDYRLEREIVNKYYEVFTQKMGLSESISFQDFYRMFNKCMDSKQPENFKLRIVEMMEEFAFSTTNDDLDNLYGRKK